MEYIALIGTVTLIHLLAVVSPGPDFIIAIKNSLTYSRKTGILTAFGFSLGISVHIFYCLAGIALLISQSILVFSIIKYIGAAYILYIGYKSFTAKSSHIKIEGTEKIVDISPYTAIKTGFLTNVLNPKATLFFLSLFTLVITPGTPPLVLGTVSIIMILNTFVWFSLVAIFLTQGSIRAKFITFESVFNKVFGILLFGLGIKVLLSQK
jgi:RhtB (resistance to homoserine/threonine) family protein